MEGSGQAGLGLGHGAVGGAVKQKQLPAVRAVRFSKCAAHCPRGWFTLQEAPQSCKK